MSRSVGCSKLDLKCGHLQVCILLYPSGTRKTGRRILSDLPAGLSFPSIISALCLRSSGSLLLDASLLAGELAQIVELSAAHLTDLVDLDAVNVG
jgi:hypothetical protein